MYTRTAFCVLCILINTAKYARLKLQIINVTTYSKKTKSFWQSYGSVIKIIDKSLMHSLFDEQKECELMCNISNFAY